MGAFHKAYPEITARARQMRCNPTPAETCLWSVLRNQQVEGSKFVRQYPIPPYIVDFCCREKKLVVEVDGSVHLEHAAEDLARDQDLEELGYHVIRFKNADVLNNINAVITIIQEAINSRLMVLSPSPNLSPLGRAIKLPLPFRETMAQGAFCLVVVRGEGKIASHSLL